MNLDEIWNLTCCHSGCFIVEDQDCSRREYAQVIIQSHVQSIFCTVHSVCCWKGSKLFYCMCKYVCVVVAWLSESPGNWEPGETWIPEYMQTRDQNCVLVLIRDRNGSSSSKKELCWSRCKIVAYGEEICHVVKEEKHQFKPFSSMSSSLCSQYHLVYKALSFRGAVKKGT